VDIRACGLFVNYGAIKNLTNNNNYYFCDELASGASLHYFRYRCCRKQSGFYKKGSSTTSSKWKDLLNNRTSAAGRGSKSSLTQEISVLSRSQGSLSFRGMMAS
jgi:hypothetical protein